MNKEKGKKWNYYFVSLFPEPPFKGQITHDASIALAAFNISFVAPLITQTVLKRNMVSQVYIFLLSTFVWV